MTTLRPRWCRAWAARCASRPTQRASSGATRTAPKTALPPTTLASTAAEEGAPRATHAPWRLRVLPSAHSGGILGVATPAPLEHTAGSWLTWGRFGGVSCLKRLVMIQRVLSTVILIVKAFLPRVLRETIRQGRPRFAPRVFLSTFLSDVWWCLLLVLVALPTPHRVATRLLQPPLYHTPSEDDNMRKLRRNYGRGE